MTENIAAILNNHPSDNLSEALAILDFLNSWALSRQGDSMLSSREMWGFALALDAASMRISQAQAALTKMKPQAG